MASALRDKVSGIGAAVQQAASNAANALAGPPPSHWHTGVCDCTEDTDICCQTFWCDCCTASNILNKLENRQAEFDMVFCLLYTLAGFVTNGSSNCWLGHGLRRELISKYNIVDESVCYSCLYAHFCTQCSACLIQREMKERSEHCGGFCAKPPPVEPAMGQVMGNMAQAVGAVVGGPGGAPPQLVNWVSGTFDMKTEEFLDGCCCLPCMYGYIAPQLDAGRVPGVPAAADTNNMDCASCIGAFFAPMSFTYANRRELVQRYGLLEPRMNSALLAVFCSCCSTVQQRREMGHRGQWPGGVCQKTCPPMPAIPQSL